MSFSLIFQIMMISFRSNNLTLKSRFTTSDCRDIEIRTFEFVQAETQIHPLMNNKKKSFYR